jgi:tetratricopeptide (TPR) repeat protein
VFLRRDDDAPAGIHLRRALDALREGDIERATEEQTKAAELSPTYFEVKRVEALIAVEQRNFVKAESCYASAIALAPDHAPLRLWYSGFLQRYLQDHERALEHLARAVELDPGAAFLYLELARVLLYLRRFEDAEKSLQKIRTTEALTSKQQRQLVDLRLQLPARRADMLFHMERYEMAMEQLEAVKSVFELTEQRLLDEVTIRNLRKCGRIAQMVGYRLGTADAQERIQEFLSWLNGVSGQQNEQSTSELDEKMVLEVGEGRVVSLQSSYGLIEAESGRYFFHKNVLAESLQFDEIRVGDYLIFDFGYNHQGLCAVNVRTSL